MKTSPSIISFMLPERGAGSSSADLGEVFGLVRIASEFPDWRVAFDMLRK